MKIILLKQVDKLGKKDNVKKVKHGYAANFLIPRGLAILASPKALVALEARKKTLKAKTKAIEQRLKKMIDKLDGSVIDMLVRAGERGKLFGSIGKGEIVSALKKQGIKNISKACFSHFIQKIDEKHIELEKPIKEVGKYSVKIDMGLKKKAKITLCVKAQKK